MTGLLWNLVARRLRRHLPAARVEPVLVDLAEDYLERRRQTGSIRAAAWLAREARSLAVAYRADARASARGSDRMRLDLMWRTVMTDIARLIRRHPGYVAFATTTLAVAVGMNLIVFTVVNALWLRPLPFPNADRLVTIDGFAFVGLGSRILKPFEMAAGQVRTTDSGAAAQPLRVALDGVGREIETLGVTSGYFQLLGLNIRGRDFTAEDDRVGAEPVAIISDRLWSREFARRDDVIGGVVGARPFPIRIIGVAPPGFAGARRGERADLWIPSKLVSRLGPASSEVLVLMGFARLHPAQTPADVMRQLRDPSSGDIPRLEAVAILPIKDVFGTPESRTILIREGNALGVVAGLALIVLLGGCATLAALVLVHYERRRRELAVRIAIGASRGRLTGVLTRELAVIGVAGVAGALLVATWGLQSIPSLPSPGGVDLGRLDLSFDWRVFCAAVLTTMITLVAAASLPVGRFTRASLAGELLAGPAATASVSSQRMRQSLLALHVTATIIVLVAAGLFVRAVAHGFGEGPGFDADRTAFLTVRLKGPTMAEFSSAQEMMASLDARASRLQSAIEALPGVERVAGALPHIGPVAANMTLQPQVIETPRQTHELTLGTLAATTPDVLSTLGVPIVAGHGVTAADVTVTPSPVVVTATLAQMLWPDENPLGQVMTIRGRNGCRCQVVGVARDFAFGSLTRPAAGVIVRMRSIGFGAEPRFVVRAANADTLVESIRKVVLQVEPDARLVEVTTGRGIVATELGRQRLGAWFFTGFGLTALLLGVGGVFGLVAYLAESRQREFGVRLALGATPRDLMRHGIAAGLVPVSIGVAAGLIAAALVARVFTSLLIGLSALDPVTYVTVAVVMLGCAGLAGLSAAWRLRRTMPSDSLRTT
jgi:putative ABC transport system permease protein